MAVQGPTAAATVSRWARRYLVVAALALVLWQAGALLGLGRRFAVTAALYGFLFHAVFGKAYSLLPSYFDRSLAFPRAPAAQLPLTVAGAGGMTAVTLAGVPGVVGDAGAALWAAGVAVFLATIGWTVRDNPTGAETGTGEANAERRPVDRYANAFVPVALLYLGVGAYQSSAPAVGLPAPLSAYPPRATHLLAAGAGALGPALLAAGVPAGPLLHAGATVEGVAVLGYALAVLMLFARSERRRIGLYGVVLGAVGAVLAVVAALWLAFRGLDPGVIAAHRHLALLGFLGVTVVGVVYQFYPPAVATASGVGDRTALASLAALAGGALLAAVGHVASASAAVTAGRIAALAGALTHAVVLISVLSTRARRA